MSNRIVLVDRSGDVLFSGVSAISASNEEELAPATVPELPPEEADPYESCPETLRSPVSESGAFPAARPTLPVAFLAPPNTVRDGRAA